ncbi:MAG: PDZ domain-containing protein [Alphaproteobacteria bacterium]|nr:PDZ domain-containing protein [Alphaproteobacteria bacterium]
MSLTHKIKTGTAIALVIAFTSFSAIAASSDQRTAGRSTASDTYKALNLFGDVFEQVRANYVDKVSDKKLIEYALNGMLTSLDPHSNYMNEEETKAMNVMNTGEFGGLGIEVTMENGVVKVVSPIDDTPAARAGIKAGDLIVEIDGKQVMGMTLNDAIEKMRGKVGTDIHLVVVRKGAKEPLKFKLTRDIIQIKSVKYRVEKGNVGYIRITQFNAQTFPGLKKAFHDIKKETGNKLIGYVLDLRNNPGGLLDQAIDVSDAFIDKGEIVSTRGRNPDDMRRDNATPGDMADGLPVVVLINSGSASASEIVAGALQDHKRAVLLGTRSFGKGSVQTLFDAPGGGSIKLTTARYYTPSGRSIQAKGITPDIVIEPAKVVAEKDNYLEIHEADLKGALANPDATNNKEVGNPTLMPDSKIGDKKDKGKDKDGKDADENDLSNDYQLLRAVDLLEGISIYRTGGPAEMAADKGDDAGKK